jgi:RecG-like helicase
VALQSVDQAALAQIPQLQGRVARGREQVEAGLSGNHTKQDNQEEAPQTLRRAENYIPDG